MIFLSNKKKFINKIGENDTYSYAQIIIFGLNYSFKRRMKNQKRSPRILLCLQFSFDYILHIPKGIVFMVFKRRLVLYGNKRILLAFIKKLTAIRSPNIYTGKGLRLKSLRFKKKPGKVRKK